MSRFAVLAMAFLLAAGILAGCVGEGSRLDSGEDVKKIRAPGAVQAVFPGQYRFDGSYSYTLAEGPFAFSKDTPLANGKLVEIDSKVPATIGKINFGLWLPDVPEGTKVPVLVDAGPYYGNGDVVATKPATRLGKFLIENFVPYGYAIAQLSVRGTGNHGGCMDLMGAAEQADLSAAITWLGTQPWSSGAVAMIGRSYDGSTPWEVAAQGNPYLKTIVPISGLSDMFGLMTYNGTSETRAPGVIHALYYTFGFQAEGRSDENKAAEAVCPEALRGFATATYSTVAGDRGPDANDYYYVRDFERFARAKWHGSVFAIHGLQDWNVEPHMAVPLVDEMEREGYPVKLLLGQWGHMYPDRPAEHKGAACGAANTRWDWAEIMLHWFDHELKNMTTVDTGPAVQVLDSECRWRNEEHFPPHDATWATLHLAGGNKLAPQAGTAGSVLLTPSPLLEGGGPLDESVKSLPGYSADFASEALAEGIQISGLPRLHVTVTPHGPTGHLAAWLYSVSPDGKEKRIGWTQMNLLYAQGGDTPQAYVPNMPLVAKLQFEPLDAYVPAGNKVLLRVWEYTYADHLPTIPPEPVTLDYGGSAKSVVELPLVTRGPESFFTPPQPPPGTKLQDGTQPTTAAQPG